MSNEYIDLVRTFTSPLFHPNPGNQAIWNAFIDFDAEIANTSTQAAVWISALPDGARTALGSRQFRTLGPVVNFSGGDGPRDTARASAVIQLLQQLINTLPAGKVYPRDVLGPGADHNQ